MWKRIVRQTYGLGCLAVLMGLVLAACEPATPAVAAPTVSKELGDIASLTVGTNRSISLGDAFKGDKLTLSVRSNNLSVAAATISTDNRSVVVGAIGAGTATITVTATNSGGSVSQSFTVNVTAAPTPTPPPTPTPTPTPEPTTPTADYPRDCPSPLPSSLNMTLRIVRDLSGKCTLPDGHSLIYEGDRVSVHGPGEGNVWTITARKKGSPVVKINDDQTGETAGRITVIVPNTPPRLTDLDPIGTGTSNMIETLLSSHTSGTPFRYVTNTLNPGASFVDVDPADIDPAENNDQGLFRFKVLDKPDGVVIDVDRGFVAVGPSDATDTTPLAEFNRDPNSGEFTMRAVILKNPDPGKTLDILLNAYDGNNDVSDNPVRLRFTAQDPQAGSYTVIQNSDGDFTVSGDKRKLKVGNRLDVIHTITFDEGTGFTFAGLEAVDERLDRKVPSNHTHTAGTPCNPLKGPLSTWKDQDGVSLGTGCYSVRSSTNDVQIISPLEDTSALGALSTDPTLTFQMPSKYRTLSETSGASITITYHVVGLSTKLPTHDDQDPPQSQDVEATTAGPRTVFTFSKKLDLDIHKCVVTTDCP